MKNTLLIVEKINKRNRRSGKCSFRAKDDLRPAFIQTNPYAGIIPIRSMGIISANHKIGTPP
jgi:hypothetical protein